MRIGQEKLTVMSSLGILAGAVESDLSFLCWLGFCSPGLEVYRVQYFPLQGWGVRTWKSKSDLEPSSGCLLGTSLQSTSCLACHLRSQESGLSVAGVAAGPSAQSTCAGVGVGWVMGMSRMALEDQDLCLGLLLLQ